MAQLRDIKNRIDSVKKTKKMTQAMKMVAAAKFKRASERAIQCRPFQLEHEVILSHLKSELDMGTDAPLLRSNASKNQAVLVLASDKGLCGGFNANIIKCAESFLSETEDPVELYLFGNKANQHFKNKKWKIETFYEGFLDSISIPKVETVLADLFKRFESGEIGKVWLFYNEFATALSSNLTKKQLLPIALAPTESDVPLCDYFLNPNAEEVIHYLSQEIVVGSLYSAFLESQAAEQGARMAAMDSATDNASDMIKALNLVYNRQRQAQITTELSEIVAGAEALAN